MIAAVVRHTTVFATLLLATAFSYYTFMTGAEHSGTFLAVILSAGLKTSLLLWYFMELRIQSWGLKFYSLIWLAVCVTAISAVH